MPRRPKSSPSTPEVPSPAGGPPSPILFRTRECFLSWLDAHHATMPQGVWLRIAKKGAPEPSITYDEAVDAAICYGWIDGQRRSLAPTTGGGPAAAHFAQRFTPRRPRQSMWSRRNVDKATDLEARGMLRPAGLAEVRAARDDGRWDRAYSGGRDMATPGDFEAALRAREGAWEAFCGLGRSRQYPMLLALQTAKTEKTRLARMNKYVDMMASGKTP